MPSLCGVPHSVLVSPVSHFHYSSPKSSKYANLCFGVRLHNIRCRHLQVSSSKLNPWEQASPPPHSPVDEADREITDESPINTSHESDQSLTLVDQKTKESTGTVNKQPHVGISLLFDVGQKTNESTETITEQPQVGLSLLFKQLMWLLGPSVLLTTGMVPTLWLPLSSIFLGPNIASLLSLVGLDCIFNTGATLFLLMAHSCAGPSEPLDSKEAERSEASKGYQFWNTFACIVGYAIPLAFLFNSRKGFIQPQLSPISFLVLFGPYLLLLSVQMLTEMLTWVWRSPVWLVAPVVYEAYRVLQLMRSLKLSLELGVPDWTVEILRGLVCWWVVILGLQLMRVAWFAGLSARVRQQQSSSSLDTNGE